MLRTREKKQPWGAPTTELEGLERCTVVPTVVCHTRQHVYISSRYFHTRIARRCTLPVVEIKSDWKIVRGGVQCDPACNINIAHVGQIDYASVIDHLHHLDPNLPI